MSMYHDLLMDHARNPQHTGTLQHATHHAYAKNMTCGDSVSVDCIIEEGKLTHIAHTTVGCAICTASASMLSEVALGKPPAELLLFSPEDITTLLGIELTPNRLKCALLPLETLQKALQSAPLNSYTTAMEETHAQPTTDNVELMDPANPSGPIIVSLAGSSKQYKIWVERDLCIGAATCIAVANKAYILDDEAKAILLKSIREETYETILDSAMACPAAAIYIEDVATGKRLYPEE